MPKQLTQTFVNEKLPNATGKQALKAFTPDKIAHLCSFVPPQNPAAWLAATDVAGHLSNRLIKTTKSRGDTLQAVDRAYNAWINYPDASGGIMHFGNAENLKTMLAQYMGKGITGSVELSAFSTNYRNERNQNNVMGRVYDLVTLITALNNTVTVDNEEKRKETRENMLALIANINVNWNWQGNALGGLSLLPGVDDVIGATAGDMKQEMVRVATGGAAVVGAVAYGAYEASKANALKRFTDMLTKIKDAFCEWGGNMLAKLRKGDPATYVSMISNVLKVVLKYAAKAASEFVGSVTDITQGVIGVIQDAITRSKITLQSVQLVTVEAGFAKLRTGIKNGIIARQAVAGWSIVKGTASTAASALASPAASKIIDLVLGGFEFGFKMLYNYFESERIKKFRAEAVAMWTRLAASKTAPVVVAAPAGAAPSATAPPSAPVRPGLMRQPAIAPSVRKALEGPPPPPTGSMVEFKAAGYTPDQFVNNWRGAFLNFLDSMVKASPIMAAVVVNSGLVGEAADIFHAATPRSDQDETVLAVDHLKIIQQEAKELYQASGFEVLPATISELAGSTRETFEKLLKNCQMKPQNPVLLAP